MHEKYPDISLDDLADDDEAAWSEAYPILYREIHLAVRRVLSSNLRVDWDEIACSVITDEVRPGLRLRRTSSFRRLGNFSQLVVLSKGIAAKRSIDVARRNMRKGEQSLPEFWGETFESMATEGLEINEGMESFRRLVSRLKPPRPEIFFDHYVLGMTYAEIAEKHMIPLSTVCSHFRRGLKDLRDDFDDDMNGEEL